MRYLILLLFFYSCGNKTSNKILSKDSNEKCLLLKANEKPINNLLKNNYAKLLSDTFVKEMYQRYGSLKLQNENNSKDSISVLGLNIIPYVMANPYGDSSVYDLIYFVTDENCSAYYDSLLRQSTSIIHGIRFSIPDKKVLCLITSGRQLIIDSTFLSNFP